MCFRIISVDDKWDHKIQVHILNNHIEIEAINSKGSRHKTTLYATQLVAAQRHWFRKNWVVAEPFSILVGFPKGLQSLGKHICHTSKEKNDSKSIPHTWIKQSQNNDMQCLKVEPETPSFPRKRSLKRLKSKWYIAWNLSMKASIYPCCVSLAKNRVSTKPHTM